MDLEGRATAWAECPRNLKRLVRCMLPDRWWVEKVNRDKFDSTRYSMLLALSALSRALPPPFKSYGYGRLLNAAYAKHAANYGMSSESNVHQTYTLSDLT